MTALFYDSLIIMKMPNIKDIQPLPKDLAVKITILKSMMYCGVLWGLFHEGWGMMRDQDETLFPFWLNSSHAANYAKENWPNYTPRKITPEDFEQALLPTLHRLNVTPVLVRGSGKQIKLTIGQVRHFFFSGQGLHFAA